eukprot:TRINITY_DN3489_c0_g2_i1.p1 TRINITY_DN3489_c0_g2~~TRINITY_DN3489_c0_g2_i1.p1  ORF type:complete len:419 (-),score=88.98 TRINITY_DN3489_c0_g2_i1:1389-2495(-)
MNTKESGDEAIAFFDQLSSSQPSTTLQKIPRKVFKPPIIQKPVVVPPAKVEDKKELTAKEETHNSEKVKYSIEVPIIEELKKEEPTLIKPIARKAAPVKPEEKKFTPAIPVIATQYTKGINMPFHAAISNKGLMVYYKNNKMSLRKLSSIKETECKLCIELHKMLFEGFIPSTIRIKEIVDCIHSIMSLEGIADREKLLWKLAQLAFSCNSISFLSTKPEFLPLHQGLISLLDTYKPSLPITDKKMHAESVDLSRREVSEEVLLKLAHKGNWMEAMMLAMYVNPVACDKIAGMYVEVQADNNPLYTFLLINQCKVDRIFELNPNLLANWNQHLAFVLRNIKFCNPASLLQFLKALSLKLQPVILQIIP